MKSWLVRSCAALAIALMALGVRGAEPRTEDVAMTARCDGSTQRYVLIYPSDFQADKPMDLLIALHGHGSDRFQFVKDRRR